MTAKPKLFRITTVPISLDKLLSGQMRAVSPSYDVTAISAGPEAQLKRVGDKEGVRVWLLEMTRKITPLKDMSAVWNLLRFIRAERPKIVHSHTPKAGIVGMLASRLGGVRHRLHTVAGLPMLETTGRRRKLLWAVEWLTMACASRVYPNSFVMRDILVSEGLCPPEKLKVLGNGSSNGIDTTHFSRTHFPDADLAAIRAKLGLKGGEFIFVFVGRLVRDKGLVELVSAFNGLSSRFPEMRLLFVGDYEPDLDPLPDATLTEIKRNPAIIEAGFQSDVRPFFAISDVLAFPSYREGFPNVVMQAAALDLPCIVSDINGCNEIIQDSENGLIVPAKDAAALQSAMERIYADKALYDALRQRARPSITTRFEQRLLWDAILAEYDSLD